MKHQKQISPENPGLNKCKNGKWTTVIENTGRDQQGELQTTCLSQGPEQAGEKNHVSTNKGLMVENEGFV